MIESSLYFKVKHIAMPQAFKFGYDAPKKGSAPQYWIMELTCYKIVEPFSMF